MTIHAHIYKFSKLLLDKTSGYRKLDKGEETYYYNYKSEEICDCGKTKIREATYNEVLQEIENQTCKYCFVFGARHESPTECLPAALQTILELKEEIEKIKFDFDSFKYDLREELSDLRSDLQDQIRGNYE